jgi:hypothetical protein
VIRLRVTMAGIRRYSVKTRSCMVVLLVARHRQLTVGSLFSYPKIEPSSNEFFFFVPFRALAVVSQTHTCTLTSSALYSYDKRASDRYTVVSALIGTIGTIHSLIVNDLPRQKSQAIAIFVEFPNSFLLLLWSIFTKLVSPFRGLSSSLLQGSASEVCSLARAEGLKISKPNRRI